LIGPTANLLSHKVIYYASDYPHWDTEFPENIAHLSRREDLNEEAKKWLFAESAKKLYNLH
jgi:predicted TIM-barrel fold metal-dependent hydrolase